MKIINKDGDEWEKRIRRLYKNFGRPTFGDIFGMVQNIIQNERKKERLKSINEKIELLERVRTNLEGELKIDRHAIFQYLGIYLVGAKRQKQLENENR